MISQLRGGLEWGRVGHSRSTVCPRSFVYILNIFGNWTRLLGHTISETNISVSRCESIFFPKKCHK